MKWTKDTVPQPSTSLRGVSRSGAPSLRGMAPAKRSADVIGKGKSSGLFVIDSAHSKTKRENMPSKVFFGSARQARLEAKETLPAKLDLILEQLHLRDQLRKKRSSLRCIPAITWSTRPSIPCLSGGVVQAIKDGGGKPFVVDVNWDTAGAETRGYASRGDWLSRVSCRGSR